MAFVLLYTGCGITGGWSPWNMAVVFFLRCAWCTGQIPERVIMVFWQRVPFLVNAPQTGFGFSMDFTGASWGTVGAGAVGLVVFSEQGEGEDDVIGIASARRQVLLCGVGVGQRKKHNQGSARNSNQRDCSRITLLCTAIDRCGEMGLC